MKHKTCTIKELYEHFKMLGKEDYELYFECLTVDGSTTDTRIILKNVIINDEQKKVVL